MARVERKVERVFEDLLDDELAFVTPFPACRRATPTTKRAGRRRPGTQGEPPYRTMSH